MQVRRSAELLNAKRGRRDKPTSRRSPFGLRGVTIFLFVIALAGAIAFAALGATTDGSILRGVTIAGTDVGGMNGRQAAAAVNAAIQGATLAFAANGGRAVFPLADEKFASFEVDAAVANALAASDGDPFRRSANAVVARFFGTDIPLHVIVDKPALRGRIEESFPGLAEMPENAHVRVALAENGGFTSEVTPERDGRDADFASALREAEERLASLSPAAVTIAEREARPAIDADRARTVIDGIGGALGRSPVTVMVGSETFQVSRRQVAEWLDALPDGEHGVRLGLDAERSGTFLKSRTAAETREPKDAAFEMTDGKVTKFVPSEAGSTLDVQGAISSLEAALFAEPAPSGPIQLPFSPVPPKVSTENANPFAIKEIIGIGATNFRGSPQNRRHNIAVGAKSVDGTVVPAGEQFSLLKTLGAIDGSTGYLQELVIKENKTTPEFGGGLCQIGSTTFRAVLDSGLPVTERRNHSYRVPYYERDGDGNTIGPGKDATIYDPAPDFKFLNDTGSAILITTAIDGNKLTFTFWGRRDGRKADQTLARVFNVVPPPEKKIVETAELPPGEEKCTEHAHPGSDAVFTYTVTYPDGRVEQKDFTSHYKPWGEVCLLGVDPSTLAANAPPALPSADASGAMGN